MAKFNWDDYADEVTEVAAAPKAEGFSWDSYKDADDISEMESGLRGAAQGASFGFADELTGGVEALWEKAKGDPTAFGELYKKSRDESRSNYKKSEVANPASYMGGQVAGAVGTSFIPGLGALNAGKAATLAGTVGRAAMAGAAQGGLQGLGDSEAEDLGGIARDTVGGAAIGGVIGGAVPLAGKVIGKGVDYVSNKIPDGSFNKGVAKTSAFLTGADSDAALRQIQRPSETAFADTTDNYAYQLAKEAQESIASKGDSLGSAVGTARDDIVANRGKDIIPGVDDILQGTDEFLGKHKKSSGGFSGLSQRDRESLLEAKEMLSKANAEDLVKFREEVDNKLSHLYGKEGQANPYERQLMRMRGQADSILDGFDKPLNKANSEYSDYLGNKQLLGLNNERTMESVADNLYSGQNKIAKRQAAEALLPEHLVEGFKDTAANKSFEKANRPGGDNYFRRGALGVLSLGASEIATNPTINKHALRTLGQVQQSISERLARNPQSLGKFAQTLQNAASRGGNSLAATHYVLQQTNPEYREMTLKQENGDE